jgi:hypothetical protein
VRRITAEHVPRLYDEPTEAKGRDMGPAFYVMAILGCGDGQAACEQVRLIETQYASVDACNAAMSDKLMAATDLPFPEVSAQCRRTTAPAMASAQARPRG